METTPVGQGDVPLKDIVMREVVVFVDPFEEFLKKRAEDEEKERGEEERKRVGGSEEDSTTWTGKRLRDVKKGSSDAAGKVGKYLKQRSDEGDEVVGVVEEDEFTYEEPVRKKVRAGGGFGNFDGW